MLSYEETELALDYWMDAVNETREHFGLPLIDFERDVILKEIMRRRKNVDSQKDELGQGDGTEIGQGKSEVFHEVQD